MTKIGGRAGADKLISGEWVVGEPAKMQNGADTREIIAGLLRRDGAPIPVPGHERFVTRDRFAVGQSGQVPLSYIGDDFTANFLDLFEDGVGPGTLNQYTLVKSTIDGPIFDALGGRDTARIALAHAYEFLSVADRTRWYFFYVADAAGALWAIDAYWRDEGWDLEAYSVTYPRGWRGGGCIVSTSR